MVYVMRVKRRETMAEYLFTEFDSWKTENADFTEELREHEAVVFDRIYPVLEVLNQIETRVGSGSLPLDADLRKIFDVGFAFLSEQVDTCRMYLETYFKNDLHAFLEYESVINYILFVEDVRYELEEKKVKYDEDAAEALLDELEGIIAQKQPVSESLGLYVDDRVNRIVGDNDSDMYGIIDIFTDVADTLGIALYEDDEIVIGKDL